MLYLVYKARSRRLIAYDLDLFALINCLPLIVIIRITEVIRVTVKPFMLLMHLDSPLLSLLLLFLLPQISLFLNLLHESLKFLGVSLEHKLSALLNLNIFNAQVITVLKLKQRQLGFKILHPGVQRVIILVYLYLLMFKSSLYLVDLVKILPLYIQSLLFGFI